MHAKLTDVKLKIFELNNGHVVQKDDFVACIASRFPHVKLII